MANSSFKVKKSLNIEPLASPSLDAEGDLGMNSTSHKLELRDNSGTKSVVTETGNATLTNKTLVVASNTITTAASGNLAATELNTALAELQTDIDTRLTASSSNALTNKTFDADGTGNSITNIENADIKAAAAIALNKLAATTISRALVSDGSGFVSPSAVTATELGYVSGVTSSIQTQLNSSLINPMDAIGQVLYGGTAGAITKLAAGVAGQALTSGGSAAPTWSFTPITASKTTTYAIAATDEVVVTDATSGSFTVTLPTAVGYTGKKFQIKRIDQTLANAVTIATTSSQTIDGVTTRKLMTQYEQFTVVSNGSNWIVTSHSYPSGFTAYTPTGSWVSNTTYVGRWRRNGDTMSLYVRVSTSGLPTNATLSIDIPSGVTIDTSKLTTTEELMLDGRAHARNSATASHKTISVKYVNTTSVFLDVNGIATHSGTVYNVDIGSVSQTIPFTFGASDYAEAWFNVPITNWEA